LPRRKLPKAVTNPATGELQPPPGRAVATVPATNGAQGGGHPRLVIDWALVERLAMIHCTAEEIAAAIDVNKDTLYTEANAPQFLAAVARGRALGKESLRRAQFNVALGDPGFVGDPKNKIPPRPPRDPNPTMLIWLGKTVLDQREKIAFPSDPEKPLDPNWDTLPEGQRPKIITIRVAGGEDVGEV
jgi:hypothetical protein